MSVICTSNSAPVRPAVLVVIEAVSVFVAASQPYVTVSWPTVAVVPASAANEKPFAPAPSSPTLPLSVPVNVANRVPTSPAVLSGLLPVRPSSSTFAADVLLSVGVFASVIVKLKSATAVSPSPSVTVNVPATGATGLNVTASALNSYEPSVFARSSPLPRSTHCDQPSVSNVSFVSPMCVTPAPSAPASKSNWPATVAPSLTS